ncbi:MAG: ubiquinol oxidase subunit II [Pseudomonadota bacterium]
MKRIRWILLGLATAILSGCNLVTLNPAGDVAAQQGDLIIYATVLMCIVIIPVIALTLFFAWHYRSSNDEARYEPDWDHSISLEIVVWAVPLAIIICLAGLTWVATHRLDPYADLRRISADQPIDPSVEPMTVYAVAMDWKWAFIYPELGIATVNEAAVIVDRPVEWKISSTTVMNAFFVPDMAGMIYAMAGMETELNGVLNASGTYRGFSGQYSGAGFSHMNFELHAYDTPEEFDAWVAQVRDGAEDMLTRETFVALDVPTVDHPVTYFDGVADGLWNRIINQCVGEDRLCMEDMMMVDALGGGGLEGLWNRQAFLGICSEEDPAMFLALLRPELREERGAEILRAGFDYEIDLPADEPPPLPPLAALSSPPDPMPSALPQSHVQQLPTTTSLN